jgi:hypothetical protein
MKLQNEIFGERVISRNLWPPRSPDLTPPECYLWGEAKSAVYRDRPRTLNELKTAITAYIRNISQADLQTVFTNKIKRVQTCFDARGHHIQQLLQVHSEFPKALYNANSVYVYLQGVFAFRNASRRSYTGMLHFFQFYM